MTIHHIIARNLAKAALPALLVAAPAMAGQDTPAAAAEASAEKAPEIYGITAETVNHTFRYNYPKALNRAAALSGYLDQKGMETLIDFAADSDRDHVEAEKGENAFKLNPYEYQVEWDVEAEIPAYISLSNDWYTYTGGAHGMHGTKSLLWDKAADKAVESFTLFSGAEPFDKALQKQFCEQLNVQRAEKRGHPVKTGSEANNGTGFDECITPSAQTVILGSAKGKSFDTVSIYVGPYEAGPYVEGSYQVDLPVTAAIIKAVKPEYRSQFAVR